MTITKQKQISNHGWLDNGEYGSPCSPLFFFSLGDFVMSDNEYESIDYWEELAEREDESYTPYSYVYQMLSEELIVEDLESFDWDEESQCIILQC